MTRRRDVVMPGISGSKLADCIQARFPAVKILYTSGYTSDEVIHHGVSTSALNFIEKP